MTMTDTEIRRERALRSVKPLEERFWAKVEKTDTCWNWTGALTTRKPVGYGIITRGAPGRNMVTANRLSWEMHYGPIPDGLFVLHACDNRRCVRPDHLMLGTAQANAVDAARKGKWNRPPQTHCQRGHAFEGNVYTHPSTGRRMCHECHLLRSRRHHAKARAA